MKEEILDAVQGQKVQILKLTLSCEESQLDLILNIAFNDTICTICFYKVSGISIQELSMPPEINGFEIINNKQKGWEQDSNYEIRDFEDGRLRFFCKDFEVLCQ